MVITIHEFGHFIFAKMNHIKVDEFAIGMGPAIFKKQGKETLYSIRLFPIGGFCSMEGEDEESNDPRAFTNKKAWQRFLVVFAGAFFNIILGLIFMLIIVVQEPVYTTTVVADFFDGSHSSQALKKDDKIIAVNDYRTFCSMDINFAMQLDDADGYMDFTVIRDGEKVFLKDVPFEVGTTDDGTKYSRIDFSVYGIRRNFVSVIEQTFSRTVSYCRLVYKSLFMLISGDVGLNEVAGPVGTASIIGEVASTGFAESFVTGINSLLNIMALITVNLGIFNLLPFPALDGGRLLFIVIEGIFRKRINPNVEGIIHTVGFAILIIFMVFVTFSDITKLIKS